MQRAADLFIEFPSVSKEAWLAQVTKDLKDKSLDALYWHISDDLKVDPFAHSDDFSGAFPAGFTRKAGWEICENIENPDHEAANRQAMEALRFGAEGLRFRLHSLETASFERLLEGIHPDFIGLHFTSADWNTTPPGGILVKLHSVASGRGLTTQSLRGSVEYDLLEIQGIRDWRYLSDLCEYGSQHFPAFRLISVGAHPASDLAGIPMELASLLQKGNTYLIKLAENGMKIESVASQMVFHLPVGKSYFPEIAKQRAFRLLWRNVLSGWKTAPVEPMVESRFRAEVYTDDLYSNMIRATTMAMSAVLGGADRLTVLPYDAAREQQSGNSPEFARRIARNVQHLLKLESGLDQIADPAEGSYYLEKLTQQLAAAAWKIFQQNQVL